MPGLDRQIVLGVDNGVTSQMEINTPFFSTIDGSFSYYEAKTLTVYTTNWAYSQHWARYQDGGSSIALQQQQRGAFVIDFEGSREFTIRYQSTLENKAVSAGIGFFDTKRLSLTGSGRWVNPSNSNIVITWENKLGPLGATAATEAEFRRFQAAPNGLLVKDHQSKIWAIAELRESDERGRYMYLLGRPWDEVNPGIPAPEVPGLK